MKQVILFVLLMWCINVQSQTYRSYEQTAICNECEVKRANNADFIMVHIDESAGTAYLIVNGGYQTHFKIVNKLGRKDKIYTLKNTDDPTKCKMLVTIDEDESFTIRWLLDLKKYPVIDLVCYTKE